MVDQRKMARVMPKVHTITPITNIGGDDLVLPNHSGDIVKGFSNKTPVNDTDIANKKYVDDNIGGGGNPKLNDIQDPDGDSAISMGSNNIKWQFSNPASDGFNIEGIGAFTGDLLHVHQHTGNPGAVHLAHFEAVDSDVLPLCLVHATAKQLRISNIVNSKFVDFTLDAGEDLTIDPSGTGKVIINSAFDVQGNITTTGTVDGIDIATDVAANTTHRGLTNNPHSVNATDVSLGNVSNVATDDTAYNATSWDGNNDAATKNAIRDKIESLAGGHNAVTLNANATAAGLSLSTQEINYRAATNAQTGYATAAQITSIEANETHVADNTQAHTDYLLNSETDTGVGLTLTGDNGSADTQYTAQVLYNTDSTPPAASGFPIGTIYIQYTA